MSQRVAAKSGLLFPRVFSKIQRLAQYQRNDCKYAAFGRHTLSCVRSLHSGLITFCSKINLGDEWLYSET